MNQQQRKQQARALQNNQLLNEAFEKAEANTFTQWRAAKDVQRREELHARMQAIQTFRSELNAIIKRSVGDDNREHTDDSE
jgi:hypothetical protein